MSSSLQGKRIIDLTSQPAPDSGDLFFIHDLSDIETKKISYGELSTALFDDIDTRNGTYSGSFSGSFTGTASYANRTLTASYALNSIGEANTAANVGTSGIGLYEAKVGTELQFRNLVAGTNVTLNYDSAEKTVQITVPNTSTTPGGTDYSVQYKTSANSFSGDSNFVYDPTLGSISVGGAISSSFIKLNTAGVAMYGTSSWAQSASFSTSASAAINSTTAIMATSSSYSLTSSYAANLDVTYNTSTLLSWPVGGTATSFAHGFGTVPRQVRWVGYCNADDAGYTAGMEVDITSFFQANGFSDDDTMPAFSSYADVTYAYAGKSSYYSNYVVNPTGTPVSYNTTKWNLKCYVIK